MFFLFPFDVKSSDLYQDEMRNQETGPCDLRWPTAQGIGVFDWSTSWPKWALGPTEIRNRGNLMSAVRMRTCPGIGTGHRGKTPNLINCEEIVAASFKRRSGGPFTIHDSVLLTLGHCRALQLRRADAWVIQAVSIVGPALGRSTLLRP